VTADEEGFRQDVIDLVKELGVLAIRWARGPWPNWPGPTSRLSAAAAASGVDVQELRRLHETAQLVTRVIGQ
jgi:hypothetical protein